MLVSNGFGCFPRIAHVIISVPTLRVVCKLFILFILLPAIRVVHSYRAYIRLLKYLCSPISITHFCPPFQHLLSERLTSLAIMGEPRVPPLNPSETIVL